jgi:AAA+ ATPase superfamily predicted ATPase
VHEGLVILVTDGLITKPADMVDRDREWASLVGFATGSEAKLRIGIVSGRRRHGKSFLLQHLARQLGGLYLTAVEEDGRASALRRFSAAVAAHSGLPASAVAMDDWEPLLRAALTVAQRTSRATPLVVIDELPYLLRHSPEIPGLLQRLYDESQFGQPDAPGGRLILCGSAMSVMSELLSDTKPLRGRAVLDLRLAAFDYRDARRMWQIEDTYAALLVHSVLGGAPGYRALADAPVPHGESDFPAWVQRTVLDPALALYSRAETEYLLREDPRITHRSLYYDILGAMASGASTAGSIGSLLGRERGAMTHPLDVLESTGYVTRSEDILRPRKPTLTLTDPIVRFNQLITLPYVPLIEDGRAADAWSESRPTFHAKILGPHFEELTRIWTRRYARDETDGLEIGPVGSAEIYDAKTRTKHEVDVLALAPGERPHSPRARITLLGEAKATLSPRGPADLDRLDRIRTLIGEQGHDVRDTKLGLFSLHGFDRNLHAAAAARDDVLLIGLSHLYGG